MEIKLYAMTCGHVTCDLGHLMAGGEGRIRIPIPAYLIQHSKGIALFATSVSLRVMWTGALTVTT